MHINKQGSLLNLHMLALAQTIRITANVGFIFASSRRRIYRVMLDSESKGLTTDQDEVGGSMGEKLKDDFLTDWDFGQSGRSRTLHS